MIPVCEHEGDVNACLALKCEQGQRQLHVTKRYVVWAEDGEEHLQTKALDWNRQPVGAVRSHPVAPVSECT